MKKIFQILCLIVICLFFSIRVNAQVYDSKITTRYNKLLNEGQFNIDDYHFLDSIKDVDIANSPDSINYRYHFLISSWLVNEGIELQKRILHIDKALTLVESKPNVLESGVFSIEYLWLSNAMADCYEEEGNIDKAILQYERTLVRGERLMENCKNRNLRQLKSNSLSSLGVLYIKKGYKKEAVDCFEKAFEIFSVDYKLGETETYFPLFQLANFYKEEKEFNKAIEKWKQLINFFESKSASITDENANAYYFLGNTYSKMKDFDSAITAYHKSISIYKQLSTYSSNLESVYGNLLCTYAKSGNNKGFENIKAIIKEFYSSRNDMASYYNSLWAATSLFTKEKQNYYTDELLEGFSKLKIPQQVKVLIKLGEDKLTTNPNDAILYCQKAIDIINKSEYKDSAFGWYYSLFSLRSLAYQYQRNYTNAVDDAQKSLFYCSKCNNSTDTLRQQILFEITNLYIANKNYNLAAKTENTLIPLTIQLFGTESQEYMSNMTLLGIALMYDGEHKKAITIFNKLMPLCKMKGGENNIIYATNLHNLGRAYMLKGDSKSAINLLNKAKELQLKIDGVINEKTNQYLKELGIYE